MKYHGPGSLNNRSLFLTMLSKIKLLAEMVSSEISLLGLLMTIFSQRLHVAFYICVCVLISSSYKATSHCIRAQPHNFI